MSVGVLEEQQVGRLLDRLKPGETSPLKHQISHRRGDSSGPRSHRTAGSRPAIRRSFYNPHGACALRKQTPQAPMRVQWDGTASRAPKPASERKPA